MNNKILMTAAILVAVSCTNKFHEGHVTFPSDATDEEKIDLAVHVVPSKRQLEWQKLELTAFTHFTVNTFTGKEWGDGTEDPSVFNPSDLDCRQWVRTLKNAGFKMVILTAKHHDGFCLWPTATTTHSVTSSSWRDGRGDVVKELREACDEYGMKLGLYLSPWDRNAESYGTGDAYNAFFIAQLTELLSNYGKIDEVWFDGANGEGPNGKKQEYDWDSILATVRKLQPQAVIAIYGDDVRWVGNEDGLGRETEWSVTPLMPASLHGADAWNASLGIDPMSKDLGSRELLAKSEGVFWYPSEVDVSIRNGWFYHKEESPKDLPTLVDIYFKSVGRNSVLLLNVPPDTTGRIAKADSLALVGFHEQISSIFDTPVFAGKVKCRHDGENYVFSLKSKGAADGRNVATSDSNASDSEVNVAMICEDISHGQRIEAFDIEGLTDEGWTTLATGTTIGYKRLLRFPTTTVKDVRLIVHSSRSKPHIASFDLFYAGGYPADY